MKLTLPSLFLCLQSQLCRGIIIGASLLLAGCQTTPPGKPITQQQAQQQRQFQEKITLLGRVSIQYLENQEPQNIQLDYEWQQQVGLNTLQIGLSTSLGQTVARIKQNAMGASLEQAKQATRYASDTEQLLADSLGWTMPVKGLTAWLQGFDLNTNDQLVAMPVQDAFQTQSQGWRLRVVSWQDLNQRVLPRRIDLERETEALGLIKIRILVDELK